jgi:hypothetical protein
MINICKGITSKNTKCKSHIKNETYCRFHLSQKPIIEKVDIEKVDIEKVDIEKEQCCVCFDEENFPSPLFPCGHLIHRKCVFNTGTNLCPLCRIEIKLSKTQLNLMNIRAKKFKEEDLSEEYQALVLEELEYSNLFNDEERLNILNSDELAEEIELMAEQYFDIIFMLDAIANL